MSSYTVTCDFELQFQPAMKKTPERLQEIVADELNVEPIEITSMSIDHEIPRVRDGNSVRVLLEDGTTTVSGTYERPARH